MQMRYPPEIWLEIVGYLSKADLRSISLTCHLLADCARRYLFTAVFTRIDRAALQKIDEILASPRVCRHITFLRYRSQRNSSPELFTRAVSGLSSLPRLRKFAANLSRFDVEASLRILSSHSLETLILHHCRAVPSSTLHNSALSIAALRSNITTLEVLADSSKDDVPLVRLLAHRTQNLSILTSDPSLWSEPAVAWPEFPALVKYRLREREEHPTFLNIIGDGHNLRELHYFRPFIPTDRILSQPLIFPSLRIISGHIPYIIALIPRCPSLKSVGVFESVDQISELFATFKSHRVHLIRLETGLIQPWNASKLLSEIVSAIPTIHTVILRMARSEKHYESLLFGSNPLRYEKIVVHGYSALERLVVMPLGLGGENISRAATFMALMDRFVLEVIRPAFGEFIKCEAVGFRDIRGSMDLKSSSLGGRWRCKDIVTV